MNKLEYEKKIWNCQRLDPLDKLVGIVIGSFMNEHGDVLFLDIEELAKYCSLGVPSVKNKIIMLIQYGHLKYGINGVMIDDSNN